MILYSNRCISCQWRTRLQDLKHFVKAHGENLVTKRTNYDRAISQEAKEVSVLAQPFIYNEGNGKSVEFMADNWEDLYG